MVWRIGVALLLLASGALSFAQLKPGTKIRLTVQRTLSTYPRGGVLGLIGVKPITREDSLVVFEVDEDVYDDDGNLIIPKGAPATGTVIDSQVGGGFKPHAPRLAVTIDRVLMADGEFLPVRFDTQHEGKWARVFNRRETGNFVDSITNLNVQRAFSRPENQDAVKELFSLVARGEVGDMIREPKKALKLRYLADQSGLPFLARFLQDGKLFRIASLIADIQNGAFVIRSISDGKRLLEAYKLVEETWRAGSQLVGWLGGRLKAPQIVVPAGFPVEAVVGSELPDSALDSSAERARKLVLSYQ